MIEMQSHLKARYLGNPVTPNRVDMYLHKKEETLTGKDIWLMMPPEIVQHFLSNHGNIKEKKLKKFLRGLDDLLTEYKPIDILKMDEDCIRKDGSINEMQLKKILTEGTGI